MNIMTLLIGAALLGVIASLIMGLSAMRSDGAVGQRTSAQWMTMRVTFQAVALVLILMTLAN